MDGFVLASQEFICYLPVPKEDSFFSHFRVVLAVFLLGQCGLESCRSVQRKFPHKIQPCARQHLATTPSKEGLSPRFVIA